MIREEILKVWSSFKEKVNKLKLNYQTHLSLMLSPQQISALEQELQVKESQLTQLRQKQTTARVLSRDEQKNLSKLFWEIDELKEKLENQKELRNINWETFFENKRWLRVEQKKGMEYFEQAKEMHKKYDRVVDLIKAKNWTKMEQLLLQKKL